MLAINSRVDVCGSAGPAAAAPGGNGGRRGRRCRQQSRISQHHKDIWITCLLFGAFGLIAFAHALTPSISPPPQKRGTQTV